MPFTLSTDEALGLLSGPDGPEWARKWDTADLRDIEVCIAARAEPVHFDGLLILIAAAIARCLKEDDAQTAREWAELFGVPARMLPEKVARGFITAALHRGRAA